MSPETSRIVAFYSYKGGTGRSMALANFAWILAAAGKKVLVIDWDLEAPGLHRYFRPFLVDPDLFQTDGLIDTFWNFAASALERSSSPGASTQTSKADDIATAIENSKRRLKWNFATDGCIDFIGAGRQGATYSERVNTFDWKRFYDLGGAAMLSATKGRLRGLYDWVLIDSRTGVSDTAGICTMQMPDTVVCCFTLNRQSIDGVAAVMRSIRGYSSETVDGSKIQFFPVATRIENGEQARLEVARRYARAAMADFLPGSIVTPRDYWDKMEIAYKPAYAFEEILAAFGDATGAAGASDTMASQMEAVSQQIAFDNQLRLPEILEADRAVVLAKYAFGPSDPESAKKTAAKVREDDVSDTEFLRGLRIKEEKWRGNGYNWRDLMSRRELDLLTDEDRREFGRNMTYYFINSQRAQQLFKATDIGFACLWSLVIAAAVVSYPILRDVPQSPLVVFGIAYGGMFVLFFIAFLLSVIVSRITDQPHGMRPLQVFILLLYGPLRPTIRDYEPSERRMKT